MAWSELEWPGVGWSSLEWIGVGWSGLEWVGAQFDKALIKLSLDYSFREMFFIGQNLIHVLMKYSFVELFDLLFINSSFINTFRSSRS